MAVFSVLLVKACYLPDKPMVMLDAALVPLFLGLALWNHAHIKRSE